MPGIASASAFILRGVAGDALVQYDSQTPLADFLGDALQQLEDGP